MHGVGMFMDCPPIVCRQIICTWTVPVVCWLGWKTADKVCKSGRFSYSRVHSYFLQCVINLFVKFVEFVKFCTLFMNWLIQEKMFTYFYNKFRPVNCMHYIKFGVNSSLLT